MSPQMLRIASTRLWLPSHTVATPQQLSTRVWSPLRGRPTFITYTAQDKCCNSATPVTRTVAVISPCISPEVLCSSGEGVLLRLGGPERCARLSHPVCFEVKRTLLRALRFVPAFLSALGEGAFLTPGHAALFVGR